jgi:Tol biopolymer transport system component
MRYDLETKRTSLILTKRDPLNPSWSPDGLRLVFCTNGQPAETGQGLIWIVNADGSDVHRLMPDLNGSGMCPVWSTGGREIVWTHGKDLWIADTNGQNAHQVYAETAHSFEVAWDWSPDGRTILFSVNDDPRGGSYYRLFFVGKDGTGKRPHPVEIDAGVGACWSRDGARVYNVYGQSIQVFSTLDPKPIREYIVPNKFGVPSTLSLAPDESFVVFSNETANQGDVWMFLMRL